MDSLPDLEEDEMDEMDYADENEREKAVLKRQIAKLTTRLKELHNKLEEEASIREKAAQYGMSLLEDNRLLGTKIYELENQNEAYKVELDACNMVGGVRPFVQISDLLADHCLHSGLGEDEGEEEAGGGPGPEPGTESLRRIGRDR